MTSYPKLEKTVNTNTIQHKAVSIIVTVLVCATIFIFSLVFSEKYYSGDQEGYTRFYNLINGRNLLSVQGLQISTIGGAEPLFGILMWIGSSLDVPKVIYLSAFNAAFGTILFSVLRSHKVNILYIGMILTNYYVFVLFFSAERLKFAYLAIIAGAVTGGWLGALFLISAPLFHIQILALLLSYLIWSNPIWREEGYRLTVGRAAIGAAITIITVAAVYALRNLDISSSINVFSNKVSGYSSRENGILDSVGTVILMAVGTWVTSHRLKFVASFFPLILSSIVFGESRVNIMAFSWTIWVLVKEGRSGSILLAPILAYFFYKAIIFLIVVDQFGQAYAQGL